MSNSKENVPPMETHRGFHFKNTKPNRRHTMTPLRGILKASSDNNTIAVLPRNKPEKRRVSFAPDVTLHRITHYTHYSISPQVMRFLAQQRLHPRSGIVPRRYSLPIVETREHEDKESNKDDKSDHEDESNVAGEIDEDNSTQTMDLSVNVTNQIKGDAEDKAENATSDSKEFDGSEMFKDAVSDLHQNDGTESILSEDVSGIVSDNETKTMDLSRRTTMAPELNVEEEDATKTMDLTSYSDDSESRKHRLKMSATEYDSEHQSKRIKLSKSTSTGIDADSSFSEQVTELVPLTGNIPQEDKLSTPVKDDSLQVPGSAELSDELESFTDEDDDYENVTLGSFLKEVNVQFFDAIGPSDRELVVDVDDEHKPLLIDYVKAVNGIPEFRYFEHLINQYRTSIQNIRGIVSDFEKNVREDNPTSMREYYEQSDEVRNDLRINYQALANYARQTAQKENLAFLANLLKQLRKSYVDSTTLLDTQLNKVLEIRKEILLRQQQLIEKKAKVRGEILELQQRKMNIKKEDTEQVKKLRKEVDSLITERKTIDESNESARISLKITNEKNDISREQEKNKEIEKEIQAGSMKIQQIHVPSDDEISSLRKKLELLESNKNVKVLEVSDHQMKVLVMEDVEIDVDLQSGKKVVNIVYKNELFEDLVQNMGVRLQSIHDESLGRYIGKVRNEWIKFREMIRDLTILKLRYRKASEKAGMDGFIIYSRGQFKLQVNYAITDLFKFDNPIKTTADVFTFDKKCSKFTPQQLLENAISQSKLEIPLLQRMQL